MDSGFDPVSFVREYNSEKISDPSYFKGFEQDLYANIVLCFTRENAPKLEANLSPDELANFRESINLLRTSGELSHDQKDHLNSLANKIGTILDRAFSSIRHRSDSEDQRRVSPMISLSLMTPREQQVIDTVARQANRKIASSGIVGVRVDARTMMEYIFAQDRRPWISPEGYVEFHLPWIVNPDNSDETLEIVVKVDKEGHFTGEMVEFYLTPSEREGNFKPD